MIIVNIKSSCNIVSICIKLIKPENKKKMYNNFFVILSEDNAIGKAFPYSDLELLNTPTFYESFQNNTTFPDNPTSFVCHHIIRHTKKFRSLMYKK